MDSVVERLGGYLTRASEAGAFTTEILLPQGMQFVPQNEQFVPGTPRGRFFALYYSQDKGGNPMEQKEQQGARYTMLQNAWYMVRLAWRERKSVLWLCLALAGLHVAISLAELFLAPLALGKVEAAAPLPELAPSPPWPGRWPCCGPSGPTSTKTPCSAGYSSGRA